MSSTGSPEAQGGALYSIVGGRPRLSPTVTALRSGRRRADELADVVAAGTRLGRRVQYWTFGDVADTRDRGLLQSLPFVHDLTVLDPRPIGSERAKTHGHVHVGIGGMGFAEVYEVLEGHGAVYIQDLLPGPTASFAVLVEARAGGCIVIPPWTHHAAVNLGSSPLVLSDVVARSAKDEYSEIRASRGMAYSIGLDGAARPNPTYERVPMLTRVATAAWSDVSGPLYARLLADPDSFSWLSDMDDFRRRFPALWARYCEGTWRGGMGGVQGR